MALVFTRKTVLLPCILRGYEKHYATLFIAVPPNDTQHSGLNTFAIRSRKFSSILKSI